MVVAVAAPDMVVTGVSPEFVYDVTVEVVGLVSLQSGSGHSLLDLTELVVDTTVVVVVS